MIIYKSGSDMDQIKVTDLNEKDYIYIFDIVKVKSDDPQRLML